MWLEPEEFAFLVGQFSLDMQRRIHRWFLYPGIVMVVLW